MSHYILSFMDEAPHYEYKLHRHWFFWFWYRMEKIAHTRQVRRAFYLSKETGDFIMRNPDALNKLLREVAPKSAHGSD